MVRECVRECLRKKRENNNNNDDDDDDDDKSEREKKRKINKGKKRFFQLRINLSGNKRKSQH